MDNKSEINKRKMLCNAFYYYSISYIYVQEKITIFEKWNNKSGIKI